MKQTSSGETKALMAFRLPRICLFLLSSYLLFWGGYTVNAQKKARGVIRKSVSTSISSDYQQLGNTALYYAIKTGGVYVGSIEIGTIDLIGKYGDEYYSSTFSDYGYVVAMKVGDNDAVYADCLNGTTIDGVVFSATIEPQGEMARVVYSFTNTDSVDKTISVGAYDDAYVGDVINASISKKNDLNGITYGISLSDRAGAELCVIFGNGLSGVTGVDDFWFGSYYTNAYAENVSGNYSGDDDDNYMIEGGSYDCGIGWCWKDRIVKAGSSLELSYLIAIGDVSLEPSSSFEVTPDDPEGWNDLSRPHRLTLQGEYESPAGLDGMIEYAVEDSEEWLQLTDTLASGDSFTASLVANFDSTLSTHTIHFRTVDNVGNATLLPSIQYEDVSFISLSGIEEKTYTGDSLYQTALSCDLADTCYVATNYQNNVNAGTASFSMEGVFPYTIGCKQYTFTINPAQLGDNMSLNLEYNRVEYDYGRALEPECYLIDDQDGDSLIAGKDYTVEYYDNILPGSARVVVKGIGNYTDSLETGFYITKIWIDRYCDQYYRGWRDFLILPDEDILYDGETHAATFYDDFLSQIDAKGIGEPKFTYYSYNEESTFTNAPSEAGTYDVYLEFAEGTLYYGMENTLVGTFTIYALDENEWEQLQVLSEKLTEQCDWGYATPWDFSLGIASVNTFSGLEFQQGHVVGINLSYCGLYGDAPVNELLGFPNLSTLNLSRNQFSGDLPTQLANAIEQNPSFAYNNITTLDISSNNLKGNVGLLASCLPNLVDLNASYNAFEDVYPMISANVTTLDLSCQTIEKVVNVNVSNISVEDIAANLPTLPFYDHYNQTYRTDYPLHISGGGLDAQVSLNNGEIMLNNLEQNTYYGNSGDYLTVSVENADWSVYGCTFPIRMWFDMGDANFKNGIDASDLQATILYAFDSYQDMPFNFTAADTYTDNNINVQDVVCTANILLTDTLSTNSAVMRARVSYSENEDVDVCIYIKGGKIILNASRPVAAISVKMSGNAEWNLDEQGLTQVTSRSGAVGYSLNGATLPIGETVIGTCQSNSTILKVSIADAEAKALKVAIGENSTTSIDGLSVNEGDGSQIYDLSGKKTNKLQRGVNIVTKNGRSYKIVNNK